MRIGFGSNRYMCFGQLNKGDVFRIKRTSGVSNDFFIKTEELVLDEKAGIKVGYPTVNALCISDTCFLGEMFFFENDTSVERMQNPQLIAD